MGNSGRGENEMSGNKERKQRILKGEEGGGNNKKRQHKKQSIND